MRERDDTDALQDALIENLAREELTPIEEARCLRVLINELGISQRGLAAQLPARSRSDITNTNAAPDLQARRSSSSISVQRTSTAS